MTTSPLPTRPPSRSNQLLQEKFVEDIASQSTRMDELARQLITLELAVPGIYAAVLKLVAEDKATVPVDIWVYLAFACWGLALALALASLIPRKRPVDMSRLFADDGEGEGPLSIEGYFRESALDKRRLLLPSCVLFFVGICGAILTVL